MTAPRDEFDLVVAGGGTSGAALAIVAARLGLSVCLLEHSSMLGGMSTRGAVGTFCGLFTSSPQRETIPTVLGREIVARLAERGEAKRQNIRFTDVVPYGIWGLARLLDEMTAEAGVEVRYLSTVTGVDLADGGRTVTAVHHASVSGPRVVSARFYADATGDASLAHLAGAGTDVPTHGTAQNATLMFRMANVDVDAMRAVGLEGAKQLATRAVELGYELPRVGGNFYPTVNPDEASCNMTAVFGVDFADMTDLSAAQAEGRRQVAEYVRFLRECVPGFAEAYLSFHGSTLGVRESRRIAARYAITEADVTGEAEFEDRVGYAAWPIELHEPDGERWLWSENARWAEIPLRSLLPRDLDNVIAVGRCIGATPVAHASTRVIMTGVSMAEGSANAIAIALSRGEDIAGLPSDRISAAFDAYLDGADRIGLGV